MSMERRISVHVEIVYTMSGRGLERDAELLRCVFNSLGHRVSLQAVKPDSQTVLWFQRKWYRAASLLLPPRFRQYILALQRQFRLVLNGNSNFNLVVHLQSIRPGHLYNNCTHWLVPNQEWFPATQLHYLNAIDTVVCKTREAFHLFSGYHANTHYTGFSSPLLSNPPPVPDKDFSKALHVAGNSGFKGTEALIRVWHKHPEWPTLTLVCNQPPNRNELPKNIEVLSNITDDHLKALWANAGIAVLPSEVEGFGQILVEAQAYGCVVITTDAPPMNEVVDPAYGVLVPYCSTGVFRMGTRYFVDPQELEQAIQYLQTMPKQNLQSMSANAIQHSRKNHELFIKRVSKLLGS